MFKCQSLNKTMPLFVFTAYELKWMIILLQPITLSFSIEKYCATYSICSFVYLFGSPLAVTSTTVTLPGFHGKENYIF